MSREFVVSLTDAEWDRVLALLHQPLPPGSLKTFDEGIIRKIELAFDEEHSEACEQHHAAHLDDPRPGAADCICSVESGDPADDAAFDEKGNS